MNYKKYIRILIVLIMIGYAIYTGDKEMLDKIIQSLLVVLGIS